MTKETNVILQKSLCNVLHHKNIDKITVTDIVNDCHLTRQTFYNHFSDIYDLVEYSASSTAKRVLGGGATYDNWQTGFYDIMVLIKKNHRLAKHVYQSIYRDVMRKYIYKVIYGYIIVIVENQSKDMNVDQKHKNFIARFYSLAFIAIIFEWINNDMKEDPKEIVDQISVLITGDFQKALQNYAK